MKILSSLLSQNVATESVSQKLIWIESICLWIMKGSQTDGELDLNNESLFTARLKYLLLQLNNNPDWKSHFVETISTVLQSFSLGDDLALAGYPHSNGFIQEFIYKFKQKILPADVTSENLSELIYTFFPDPEMAIAVDSLSPQILNEIFDLFQNEDQLKITLKKYIYEAIQRLALSVTQLTLQIHKNLKLTDKSLFDLSEHQLLTLLASEKKDITEIQNTVNDIEKHINQSFQLSRKNGVNTEIVYLFQLQKKQFQRLSILCQLIYSDQPTALVFRLLLSHLISDIHSDKSFSHFVNENLGFLIKKIVQSNSEIGEHYITFNWKDYFKMFFSACGGGAITSLTVYIKLFIGHLGLSGFIKGLLEGINYSGSFVLIQSLGCTLATKQPSTTAPYIAHALKNSNKETLSLLTALFRTQFAAVLGNVLLVMPVSFLIALVFKYFEQPLYSTEEALKTFNSSALIGPTFLYAIFTGVILFSGSLIAGWFENFYTLNKLHLRLKNNRFLYRWIGERKTESFAHFTTNNVSSLAGNISLGFLLGLIPQLMKFLNIPLEVRHVTLSAGQIASTLPDIMNLNLPWWSLTNAFGGLFIIGLINITVSFLLALLLASFATNSPFKDLLTLLKSGFILIITRPWLLFIPDSNKSK